MTIILSLLGELLVPGTGSSSHMKAAEWYNKHRNSKIKRTAYTKKYIHIQWR